MVKNGLSIPPALKRLTIGRTKTKW